MFENMYPQPYGNYSSYQNPYLSQQKQQPVNTVIMVSGLESAKNFKLPPDSAAALFNDHEDEMYIVKTDGVGFSTVRTFKFYPVENAPVQGDFVTRAEFDELKAKLDSLSAPVSEVSNG